MVRICIFGSSSNKTPGAYLKVAEELGGLIAGESLVVIGPGPSPQVLRYGRYGKQHVIPVWSLLYRIGAPPC